MSVEPGVPDGHGSESLQMIFIETIRTNNARDDGGNGENIRLPPWISRDSWHIKYMNSDFHCQLQISHQTQGRVRVKIPWLQGRPAVALALERHLAREPHVRSTSVRPITGSVIIYYDAHAVDAPQLLSRLQMTMAELESGVFSAPLSVDHTGLPRGKPV